MLIDFGIANKETRYPEETDLVNLIFSLHNSTDLSPQVMYILIFLYNKFIKIHGNDFALFGIEHVGNERFYEIVKDPKSNGFGRLLNDYLRHLQGEKIITQCNKDDMDIILAQNLQTNNCENIEKVVPKKCLGERKITKILGSGTDGTVFALCSGKDGCIALKITESSHLPGQEIANQQLAARYNLAPQIYSSCKGTIGRRQFTFITMEQIDGVMNDYLKTKRSEQILDSIAQQMITISNKLSEIGIFYTDMHPSNIGYLQKTKIMFIDYGRSKREKSVKDRALILFVGDYYTKEYPEDVSKLVLDQFDYIMNRINTYILDIYKDQILDLISKTPLLFNVVVKEVETDQEVDAILSKLVPSKKNLDLISKWKFYVNELLNDLSNRREEYGRLLIAFSLIMRDNPQLFIRQI